MHLCLGFADVRALADVIEPAALADDSLHSAQGETPAEGAPALQVLHLYSYLCVVEDRIR